MKWKEQPPRCGEREVAAEAVGENQFPGLPFLCCYYWNQKETTPCMYPFSACIWDKFKTQKLQKAFPLSALSTRDSLRNLAIL